MKTFRENSNVFIGRYIFWFHFVISGILHLKTRNNVNSLQSICNIAKLNIFSRTWMSGDLIGMFTPIEKWKGTAILEWVIFFHVQLFCTRNFFCFESPSENIQKSVFRKRVLMICSEPKCQLSVPFRKWDGCTAEVLTALIVATNTQREVAEGTVVHDDHSKCI